MWFCCQDDSWENWRLEEMNVEGKEESINYNQRLLFTCLLPVTLYISHIQDRICMSRPQAQRLIDSIVNFHVASSTRCTHQKPDKRIYHKTSEVNKNNSPFSTSLSVKLLTTFIFHILWMIQSILYLQFHYLPVEQISIMKIPSIPSFTQPPWSWASWPR